MQTSFFNTINLEGEELIEAINSAKTQEEKVLAIFMIHKILSPVEVEYHYNRKFKEVPITSIRRAITNLTKQGKLVKTEEKIKGKWGMYNYKWKLNEHTN